MVKRPAVRCAKTYQTTVSSFALIEPLVNCATTQFKHIAQICDPFIRLLVS